MPEPAVTSTTGARPSRSARALASSCACRRPGGTAPTATGVDREDAAAATGEGDRRRTEEGCGATSTTGADAFDRRRRAVPGSIGSVATFAALPGAVESSTAPVPGPGTLRPATGAAGDPIVSPVATVVGGATAAVPTEGVGAGAAGSDGTGASAAAERTGFAIGTTRADDGDTARGGRSISGSTYPSAADETRTPRCTYGRGHSGSPLAPASPIRSPSPTTAPLTTETSPRCVTETA